MPVYKYKGLSQAGKPAAGIIDADSSRSARLKLRKTGIFPTEISEDREAGGGAGLALSRGRPGRAVLTAQDRAVLTRQLGTLLIAGLPLVDALGVLIEQSARKTIQGLLADVREQIREGRALSVALESYSSDFSPIFVHMVRAGESSGALDQILFRLADFLEQQLALKNKVTNAALYPALMSAVGVAVLFFLMTFVVPKITGVFAELKQALPWPTLVLIGISRFLGTYWWLLLGAAVMLVAWARRMLRSPKGRATADRWLLKLPLVGEVTRKVAISRLASTLATMLASGVQLLEAMGVAKRVMNNAVLEQAVERARENIREGESIAEPLKRSGEFPPLVTHMIAVGEKSGEMEEMLRRISQIYDGEVDRVITRLTALMEPVMILAMGIIVFFIVVAILLPIFEMSQIVR
jgi:general secretion pathway protein F